MSVWHEDGGRLALRFSPQILPRLRSAAIEGLLSLPRVGVGIGGLLLGTRDGDRMEITDILPIPCSHATGPSFALTPAETEDALALARGVGSSGVVGFYCSKTRGILPLNPNDRALVTAFCPGPWQILLLIQPSTVEPTRALVCYRDGSQELTTGTEHVLEATLPAPEPAAKKEDAASLAPPPVFRPAPPPPTFTSAAHRPGRAWLVPVVLAAFAMGGLFMLFAGR